jgi:hypothetical protein
MTESRALRWDGGPDEKIAPGQFMREINIKIEDKAYTTDKKKIDCFRNNLDYGGTADVWFDDLPDDTKGDWDKLVEAFEKEWPKNAVPKPSKLERIQALKEWVLTVEELGTKTKTTGSKEVWTHIKWANGLTAKARDAEDSGGLLLQDIFHALPEPIRDLTRDKPRTNYDELADAVRAIDVVYLRETVEKYKKNEETARLARVANSPTKSLHDTFANTHLQIPSSTRQYDNPRPYQTHPARGPTFDPFSGNTGSRGNLFGARGPATRPYRPGAPITTRQTQGPFRQGAGDHSIIARYNNLRNITLQHHPNTETGHNAYKAQVEAWHRANPGGQPDEHQPFPLTPGTAPLASRECWECAQQGHRAGDPICPRTEIPDLERTWRRLASFISREAGKERNIAPAVNLVGREYQDYGYHNYERPYGGYPYTNELGDVQGNGRGPLA